MKKIKVAHLSSAHKFGDVRIFHKECVSLAKAGYDVTLIIPDKEASRMVDGVMVEAIPDTATSKMSRIRKTVKWVYDRALKVDADIYHFHDPELLRVGLKLKRKGKVVVFDAHEDFPRQLLSKKSIPGPFRKLLSFGAHKFENYVSKRLDAIVTATPYINERFLKVNPNSVNVNNFPLEAEIMVPDSEVERRTEVCYIGALSFLRGVEEMVIGTGLSNTRIKIAGSWQSGLKEACQKHEAWSLVDDLGFIDRKTSMEVKQASIAGMIMFHPEPNHVNAQPNKMFEYMASGLPIIASNFPLWKEIVEDNNCGICVDPFDTKAISEAILELKNSPEKVKQMGDNGRKMVREKYNWTIEEQTLFELYGRLSQKVK